MEQTTISNENQKKHRYMLAKAWNRIFARVIDVLIVTIVVAGLAIAIIATDKMGLKGALDLNQKWRYLLITLISIFISVLYFIVIQRLTDGRTLGLIMFKLKMFNLIPTKSFTLNIIKKEFFLWMIVSIANLMASIFIMFDKSGTFLRDLLFQNNSPEKSTNIGVIFCQTFYVISGVIIIFIIIHMCLSNKKRCFIDKISDTAVVKMVDVNSTDIDSNMNTKMKRAKRNYGLPGEIIGSATDEIDSL